MNFSDNYNILVKNIQENLDKYSLAELTELLHHAKDVQQEYKNLQLVVKCDANSLYGVSASIYFSLCDFDVAEDITTSGKNFGVKVDRNINKFFQFWGDNPEILKIIQEFYPQVVSLKNFSEYVPDTYNDLCVYGDTDSRYIDLGKIYELILTKDGFLQIPEDDQELAEFGCFLVDKFINKIIKDTIEFECDYRNGRKGFLKMNHEVTSRKAAFIKKKKYIMANIWEDGKFLKKPKLKYKGIELRRGSSSPRAKKILTKLVEKYMLEGYDSKMLRQECLKLIQYIKTKKDKELVYLITAVSGLKNITKTEQGYISDKTHIQMQLALSWLNFIENNKLTGEFKPAFEGQKVNYYYCNPDSDWKVIAIPDDVDMNMVPGLPEPDWNRMINATLIKPLLRYISEKPDIEDEDVEHWLLGVKTYNFSKRA